MRWRPEVEQQKVIGKEEIYLFFKCDDTGYKPKENWKSQGQQLNSWGWAVAVGVDSRDQSDYYAKGSARDK